MLVVWNAMWQYLWVFLFTPQTFKLQLQDVFVCKTAGPSPKIRRSGPSKHPRRLFLFRRGGRPHVINCRLLGDHPRSLSLSRQSGSERSLRCISETNRCCPNHLLHAQPGCHRDPGDIWLTFCHASYIFVAIRFVTKKKAKQTGRPHIERIRGCLLFSIDGSDL